MATKKQKRGEGRLVAKPGIGAPKKEHVSCNKRDGAKGTEEGGRTPKKQLSKCPHQRIRSTCKVCGGASICPSICPHQRIRSTCKEC